VGVEQKGCRESDQNRRFLWEESKSSKGKALAKLKKAGTKTNR
jgi:hypothetical protein